MEASDEIARCLREIEDCQRSLADPSLSDRDRFGAMLGANDWFTELLILQGQHRVHKFSTVEDYTQGIHLTF